MATNLLSKLAEKDLIKASQRGSIEARDELVYHFSDFIHSLVHKFYPYISNPSFTAEDLYQEGVIEFIISIDKFDTNTDFRLSTYVIPRLRKAFQEYVRTKGNKVVLPKQIIEDKSKLQKSFGRFENKMILRPSIAQLVQDTGLSERRVKKALFYTERFSYIASLDTPYKRNQDDDEELTVMDSVACYYCAA